MPGPDSKPSLLLAVVATGLAFAGCGENDGVPAPARAASAKPAGPVLHLAAMPSAGGAFHFNVKRLKAKAGLVTIQLDNRDKFPHNVRIQTGSKCCFADGSADVGGTNTTNGGTQVKGTVQLEPGRYVFLCSIGGHYDGDTGHMHGTLVVR
jgi:plastocyanin